MDATDTGVGDYGDLNRHGNYELRRVLNEERWILDFFGTYAWLFGKKFA